MKSRGAVLLFSLVAGLVVLPAIGGAQARGAQGRGSQTASSKPLAIYVVDTEGGKAVLFVTPAGESLLIDSGNPGGRDTDRIMAASRMQVSAGSTICSHPLPRRSCRRGAGARETDPDQQFIDHGPSVEEHEQVAGFQQAYAELYGKATHLVVKPGDTVPIAGSIGGSCRPPATRSSRRFLAAGNRIRPAPSSSRRTIRRILRTVSR